MLKAVDKIGIALCLSLVAPAAHAEMGNPTKPGGVYLSIEGGYHDSDAPGVATTHGDATVVNGTPNSGGAGAGSGGGTTSAAASASGAPGRGNGAGFGVGNPSAGAAAASGTESAQVFVNPASAGSPLIGAGDGGYGGATFGYALPSPWLGLVSRIEVYGSRTGSDEDRSSNGAIGLRSVDNVAAIAIAAVPVEALPVESTQDLTTTEFGLRLKSDQKAGAATLTFAAEPFYIRYDQTTRTSGVLSDLLNASAANRSDVESDIFGIQAAVEGVVPLGGPFSLVGRASAGVYSIDTDADFSSSFIIPFAAYDARVSDHDTRTGYRLGGEAGVRYALSATTWLSVTGSVDYLSEVATAALPVAGTDGPASIAYDDLLDWRAGARLTFATP